MSDKKPKGVPYGYSNAPEKSAGPRTGAVVIGIAVAVVVVAGIVAMVLTSESDKGTEIDAKQEQAAVAVTGESLPDYPADGGTAADPATDPAVGLTPPTLTGQSFDGSGVTIEPGSEPMVVIFAAHWCPHCQKEVPLIQDWIDDGNLPEGVQVNMVSTSVQADGTNYPPSGWLSDVGWSEQILLDNPDSTAASAWGLTGYPYMVFVDGEGKVVQRASGELPIGQFEEFVAEIAP